MTLSGTDRRVLYHAVRDNLLIAFLCFVASLISASLLSPSHIIASIWLPSGIALAAILVRGFHLWPGILLAALGSGIWIHHDLMSADNLWHSLLIGGINAVAETLCAVIPAWLIIRATGKINPMMRVSDVNTFLIYGALLGPCLRALIAVTGLAGVGLIAWDNYFYVLFSWWLSGAVGILLVVPVLLLWITNKAPLRFNLEFTAFSLVLLVACLLVMGFLPFTDVIHPPTFLLLPLLFWAVFRLDQRVLFSALMIIASFAIVGNHFNQGLSHINYRHETLMELQIFLVVMTISIFFLNSVVRERENAERELVYAKESQKAHDEANIRQLKHQQIFLESILDNIQDGIVACDEHGQLSLFNRATREFHGISQEQLPPEQWAKHYNLYLADGKTIMNKEDIPLFRAYQGEVVRNVEIVIAPKQGQRRNLVANGTCMHDDTGKRIGAVVSMHDISEQKQHERALITAKQDAETASHAKSIFLANMSHELRTPLNAIMGFSQLLARDDSLGPQQRDKLDNINNAGKHLLELINDVLDLSKIEVGKVELKLERFNLPRMFEELAQMFQLRAKNKDLAFHLELDNAPFHYIETDAGKLRQVLINLLGNAIKFTEQGHIHLRVHCLEPHVSGTGKHILHVEIEDSGPGIASDELDKIFDPFVQVSSSIYCKQKGTGLGLAISRSFIELMSGTLQVTSTQGQGACFYFDLPVSIVSAPPGASDAEIDVVGLKTSADEWRVLIVDDDIGNRALLTDLLEPAGFTIRDACDGEQALQVFRSWAPHFIWLDMRMPNLDGYEVARQIRQMPNGQEVKIVAITASVFRDQQDAVFAAGCDDFVKKPFRVREIFDILNKHLKLEYTYTQTHLKTSQTSTGDISLSVMQQIPHELWQVLLETAMQCDIEQIEDAETAIRKHNPAVADMIHALTEKYAYDEVIALCEKILAQ